MVLKHKISQVALVPTCPSPPPEEIFRYFSRELFEKTDKEMQDFLLKTAFLPKMTTRMAQEHTKLPSFARLLSILSRDNYFTVKSFQNKVTGIGRVRKFSKVRVGSRCRLTIRLQGGKSFMSPETGLNIYFPIFRFWV